MSGATPPAGYETDGFSLVEFFKGGSAPKRDYFYWELHKGGPAVQAARWGDWKAVRNGVNKPIEIYDLETDAGESKDLSKSRPELVARAEVIFADAHRPHPDWSLEGRSEEQKQLGPKVWTQKRWRDRTGWIPKGAVERP